MLLERKKVSSIIPLSGWVTVEPLPYEEEKTASGLVLGTKLSPAEIEKRKNKGKVVAVPTDSPVEVGCIIYYKSYAGQDCWVSGQLSEFKLIEFQDICGVLKE